MIKLENVCVDIPIYSASNRLFKNKMINFLRDKKVNKYAGGRFDVRILNDISLEINNGDRVGIIGKNGAGKSSLLRLINGVYSPTSGKINISGSVNSLIDISLGIDQDLTGLENIYMRSYLLGLSKKEIKKKLDDIINFTELEDYIHMPLRTYSSGMQMRLAFAVSTILNCEILLMDEWLSVGDETFQSKAINKLNELINNSNILIVASHSKELIKSICNKVILLENGKIKLFDNVDNVIEII